jgi:RNA polymerase sigma-70 factor, ECF subfamily
MVLKKSGKTFPQATLVSPRNETKRRKTAILFAGMTEAEVIRKAQAGDADCFEALYMQHKRRIFSLCLRMTNNYAQAEDFTQEAFLQLYRKIASFRGESAFSTWLHRLSVNIILMHWRKKGLAEVSLEETLEPQSEDGPRKDIGRRDDVLHGSIDRMTLDSAVASLAPGYRIIFVLHDVEGYEHNEIAEMLGCSIGNSKSQLHKARMKLRTMLPRMSNVKKQAAELADQDLTLSVAA